MEIFGKKLQELAGWTPPEGNCAEIYSRPHFGDRCAVSIYLSLIPSDGPFYGKPLPGCPPKMFSSSNWIN